MSDSITRSRMEARSKDPLVGMSSVSSAGDLSSVKAIISDLQESVRVLSEQVAKLISGSENTEDSSVSARQNYSANQSSINDKAKTEKDKTASVKLGSNIQPVGQDNVSGSSKSAAKENHEHACVCFTVSLATSLPTDINVDLPATGYSIIDHKYWIWQDGEWNEVGAAPKWIRYTGS